MQPRRVVICSDSASVLCSLRSGKSEREDLWIEMMLLGLQKNGIEIQFCWIPAQTGVKVNYLVYIQVQLGRGEVKNMNPKV